MQPTQIVSHQEWIAARTRLLAQEKELTRLNDTLRAERQRMPWVRVDKAYVFDGPQGPETLAQLFDGRNQLIVKHFMFGPDWDAGCVGCSFHADHMDGARIHLEQHDVTMIAVSRAPLAKIEAFRRRMGWGFRWVSSFANDFNYDFNVSFRPEDAVNGEVWYNYRRQPLQSEEMSGLSVFARTPDGAIFHTYSTFARGAERLLCAYGYLDLVPKGRDETRSGNLTDWVRHHDRYDAGGAVDATGRYRETAGSGCCCGEESK
jgi:predicted dithiol-disulfide oxidoreductase (DUF899 family)